MAFQFLIGRLETRTLERQGLPGSAFQFLIGRLETTSDDVVQGRNYAFQFLIGRLETPIPRITSKVASAVSIPHR